MPPSGADQKEGSPSDVAATWADVDAVGWQGRGRWAAPQHYMCSYMAMFPPELPHYFIERFTRPGDRVLDPFSGRGTTAVEAAAQGRYGIGNDLNPLAVALTRGKLSNPPLNAVLARLDELERGYDPNAWRIEDEPDRIQLIYHPNTLRQLVYLKATVDWSKPGVDAFIVAMLMGAMHGASKGFLSLPMPNTFSMGWGYIARKVEEEPEKFACPDRDAFEVLRVRANRQLKLGRLVGAGEALHGDVRALDARVDHGSVHLLFTSPPYLKVIKYGLYNWIRLWFLTDSGGHEEVDEVLDDTHALDGYLAFMRDTLEACLPLLDRERGLSCWAIGDVKELNLAWEVWDKVARHVRVTAQDGSELRYRLLAIAEDEIPPEEKVSRLWKTIEWVVRSVNEAGETEEEHHRGTDERAAKAVLERLMQAGEHDQSSLECIKVHVNDKSGKATPIDRILMMCPTVANPTSMVAHEDVAWQAIAHPRLAISTERPSEPTTARQEANIRYVESKTVDKHSIGMFRLSSYAGWMDADKYPKLLILTALEKTKTSFKLKNRHWDIDGQVDSILHAKVITGPQHIVPHDPELHGWVLSANTADKEEIADIKASVKAANAASTMPIKLDLPGGQSTGQGRLYLSVHPRDLHLLPDAPQALLAHLEQRLTGASFRLKKDYADAGGPSGWFSEPMLEWERAQGLYDAKKADRQKGVLHITKPSGEVRVVDPFKDGREMYWTGHAFEVLLGEVLDLPTTPSHTPGVDLGDGRLRRLVDLIPSLSQASSNEKGVLSDEGLEKVDILETLLGLHGLNLEASHWSRGSTVTKAGLLALARGMKIEVPRRPTKERLIRAMLDAVGESFEGRADVVNPGSTVTAYALLKVLRGVTA